MNLIKKNGTIYADSREVAEMTGKRHADLCRDIAKYVTVLTERNFAFSDFLQNLVIRMLQEKLINAIC